MIEHPPCWPEGQPCPNRCAARYYDHHVHGLGPLRGPWTGWRLAGRNLVAPDGQRLSQERLRGLLWRVETENRISKTRAALRAGQRQTLVPIMTPITGRG